MGNFLSLGSEDVEKTQIIFLKVLLLLQRMLVPHSLEMEGRGHGIAAGSAGGSFGLPTASQGCGRCHQAPSAAGLGVLTQGKNCTGSLGPTCATVFTSSLADGNRYQFRVCLCCQVSAQSSAPEPFCLNCDSDSEHWIKEFYSMQLLSQGKKRLCALGLSYKLSITISCSIESCFQTSL